MIIHPDGRKEGTPEELAAYENQMLSMRMAAPAYPSPYETGQPWWGIYPPDTMVPRIWSESDSITYQDTKTITVT